MNSPKSSSRRPAPPNLRREKVEFFWFMVFVILGFVGLIILSIHKALKPL